jgi:putative transposase
MKRRHHSPEQIIRKLREAERMLGEGKQIPEVAKELGVSEATFHRWRNQYGGMKADDVKELKDLRRENQTLKTIVADKELEVRALKEIARGRMKVKFALGSSGQPSGRGVASQRSFARKRPGRARRPGARLRGAARG